MVKFFISFNKSKIKKMYIGIILKYQKLTLQDKQLEVGRYEKSLLTSFR